MSFTVTILQQLLLELPCIFLNLAKLSFQIYFAQFILYDDYAIFTSNDVLVTQPHGKVLQNFTSLFSVI